MPVSTPQATKRVGVVGASGYGGVELLRLIAQHPQLELAAATGDSQAGEPLASLYPSLAAAYGDRRFETYDADALDGLDVVFFALPHGVSMDMVPDLLGRVGHVVDLGSDYRLHDPALYPEWYGAEHTHPDLLDAAAYGLPELFRDDIVGSELIAATGCNVATAVFGLAPLVKAGLIDPSGMIVDIATGVSGAGRPPKPTNTLGFLGDNVTAYGLLTHRHTPEMEQAISEHAGLTGDDAATVLFTPHLVPMNRGILATCYARPATDGVTTELLLETLGAAYADQPWMVVSEASPQTKSTLGANTVHLTARVDPRTGHVLVIGALDNLMKGAAGMAVQCANLALGLDETAGLPIVGVYP